MAEPQVQKAFEEKKGHEIYGEVDADKPQTPGGVIESKIAPAVSDRDGTASNLKVLAGPMLKYDIVDKDGVWRGGCLVVTSDADSSYEPVPSLEVEWEGQSSSQKIEGENIYVYKGRTNTATFWRFRLEIPLREGPTHVKYSLNGSNAITFQLPGREEDFHWAAYSCNGFSTDIDPKLFVGPGFSNGFDPLWTDLLEKHQENPFHLLVGGGDQLYCDSLMLEDGMKDYEQLKSEKERLEMKMTDERLAVIDHYYFNRYISTFSTGAFAKAISIIPMINMADDHDIMDGFGSYPDDMQRSPVFGTIGSRGYFWFLLFQCFLNDEIDGTDAASHWQKSIVIGGPGAYVPNPGHSFVTNLGPKTWLLMLDCRAERKRDQVCSQTTYERVFERLEAIPSGVEHVVFQLGIPIAYSRMGVMEGTLDKTMAPLIDLGKKGALKLGSALNKFNKDAELLDDLNDHWTAKRHKKERNWLVQRVQQYAMHKHVRITFVSGDVHLCAVTYFKTLKRLKKSVPPVEDHRYMLNVITSAIVNAPPPVAAQKLVASLGDHKHRTLHFAHTDEGFIPLFDTGTDDKSRMTKNVMGQRNYCDVRRDGEKGELEFVIRVEIETGHGKTKGYPIRTPPPRYHKV